MKKSAALTLCELLDTYQNIDNNQDQYLFLSAHLEIIDRMSYRQLITKSKAIAALLQKHHIKKGDRVLMMYNPSLEFVYAFFGCLYAGAIAVPCYPPVNKKLVDKLSAIIDNCEPKIILSTKEIVNKIKKLKLVKLATSSFLNYLVHGFMHNLSQLSEWDFDKFSWLTTDDIDVTLANQFNPVKIKKKDVAFLQYTSGSTSSPKGVMISHGNIIHNVDLISRKVQITPQDKIMVWLPPYHDMGLIGGIMVPLYNRIPVLLMSPIDFLKRPLSWLQAISKYKATISAAPNFAYSLCYKKIQPKELENLTLNQWRAALNGAEPINYKTVNQFTEKFSACGFSSDAFFPCYGLAESTLFVSGKFGITTRSFSKSALREHQLLPAQKEMDMATLVSCGTFSNDVMIVDPETKIPNSVGINEVCIASDSLSQGYWRNPTNDENFFHIFVNGKEQKYFKTGDLGFIEDNELYVTGRIKELIIIRGANHYPQDIEDTVYHCSHLIKHGCCAAFSIENQGEEKLVIVAEILDNLNKEQIENIISKIKQEILVHHQLAIYQIALIKSKSLHKTTSGKIQRYANRNSLQKNEFKIIANYISDNNQSKIKLDKNVKTINAYNEPKNTDEQIEFINNIRNNMRAELRNLLSIDNSSIKDDQLFSDYGLDSLLVIELENKLQKHLKGLYQLNQNDLYDHPSINELCNYIKEEIYEKKS